MSPFIIGFLLGLVVGVALSLFLLGIFSVAKEERRTKDQSSIGQRGRSLPGSTIEFTGDGHAFVK